MKPKYKVGEDLYLFDGRAFSLKKIKIESVHSELEHVYYYKEKEITQMVTVYYLFRNLKEVIKEIDSNIMTLEDLKEKIKEGKKDGTRS